MRDKMVVSVKGALFGLGSAAFAVACVVLVLFLVVAWGRLYA